MAPDSRVVDIAAKETIDGRSGQEFHLLTAIVPAREAGFAIVTNEARLDSDAIARLKVGDGGMGSDDYSSGLVAEDMLICDDHGSNCSMTPEVDVRSVRGESGIQRVVNVAVGECTRICQCS